MIREHVDGPSFYIAIHESELEREWFLSAYLSQFYPNDDPFSNLSNLASWTTGANTLGTWVVRFAVQNGHVVVFDVDRRKRTTSNFDPQVILDAYPIVDDPSFRRVRGWRNYVLFDPAAGKNEFAILGNMAAAPQEFNEEGGGAPIEVQAAFLQRFRALGDGISFEKVFVGTTTEPAASPGSVENGTLQTVGGTLGTSIRRYRESPGFVETPMPPVRHFFGSQARAITDPSVFGPYTDDLVAKWHVYPGMTPIRWLISDSVRTFQQKPQYAQYDVEGAIRRGIESWNDAFGFTVLDVGVAGPNDSHGDDDKNVFLFDDDPRLGFAFADWRVNPNTGEIRGASVYFSSAFVTFADLFVPDDATEDTAAMRALERFRDSLAPSAKTSLIWPTMRRRHLCDLDVRQLVERALARGAVGSRSATLTKKEIVEGYIALVAAHEVGHTLSLRHNFRGSLVPPSSSVMDYLPEDVSAQVALPPSYDRAAIAYLYTGTSTSLPADPFCNDDDLYSTADARCEVFDFGSDPFHDDVAPRYDSARDAWLAGTGFLPPWFILYDGFDFLWQGDGEPNPTSTPEIFDFFFEDIGVPANPALAATATTAAVIDEFAREAMQVLFYFDESPQVLEFYPLLAVPRDDTALMERVVAQLEGMLVNADEIRSFESRRVAVRLLKQLQLPEAHEALFAARDIVIAELATATSEQEQIEELLGRIERALDPYYED